MWGRLTILQLLQGHVHRQFLTPSLESKVVPDLLLLHRLPGLDLFHLLLHNHQSSQGSTLQVLSSGTALGSMQVGHKRV